jgi:hypothetical protein
MAVSSCPSYTTFPFPSTQDITNRHGHIQSTEVLIERANSTHGVVVEVHCSFSNNNSQEGKERSPSFLSQCFVTESVCLRRSGLVQIHSRHYTSCIYMCTSLLGVGFTFRWLQESCGKIAVEKQKRKSFFKPKKVLIKRCYNTTFEFSLQTKTMGELRQTVIYHMENQMLSLYLLLKRGRCSW